MIIPVILSGGSGTRLWPLSTPAKPKQFLPLVSDRTMFQETLLRLQGLPGLADPIVVCNKGHRVLVAEQLSELGITPQAIVLEPEGRNTAPAICVAALLAQAGLDQDDDAILLVLPADHVIADIEAFHEAVFSAVKAADSGQLVTFGIVPAHPETGYGYIEQGAEQGEWSAVERFVEKPDEQTAESYIETGRFLWNSGMFVFDASTLIAEFSKHVPGILEACEAAVKGAESVDGFTELGPEFLASPADSIDYAVMEKTARAAVVPLDAGWNDVGSWAALHQALDTDSADNCLRGSVVSQDVTGSLVISSSRKIALLGLDNVVVVDTGETLLIMQKDKSQDIKQLRSEADPHRNKN